LPLARLPDRFVRSATILGCRVDAVDCAEAVRRIVALARENGHALVVTLGTEMAVRAQRDERFKAVANASALSLCDTIGLLYAARLQGVRLPERVTGVELLEPLCAALGREGMAVYFLGGRGDTAARAAAALRERHPGLIVAGARDGFFTAAQESAVAQDIAASGARVLLAGLGSPRQEFFIAEHLEETGAAVGIGVGGSFDVLAGNVRRAPAPWRRMNLEWLYRLIKEPQRWRRQLALPQFVWLALRERVAGRPGGTKCPGP
jgi:N-acetylglucosaminyldiphosphoundecaprenol N-acetyl-beta-D-mannosaminyltransferase